MTETTETIICPECNLQQVATVKHTVPWKTYIHVCKGCGYIIMESEWNVVKPNNMAENLMDGLFYEMNRVREIMKEYDALPKNAGALASGFMRFDIQNSENSIKDNDVIKMLQCYSKLKEYEL